MIPLYPELVFFYSPSTNPEDKRSLCFVGYRDQARGRAVNFVLKLPVFQVELGSLISGPKKTRFFCPARLARLALQDGIGLAQLVTTHSIPMLSWSSLGEFGPILKQKKKRVFPAHAICLSLSHATDARKNKSLFTFLSL